MPPADAVDGEKETTLFSVLVKVLHVFVACSSLLCTFASVMLIDNAVHSDDLGTQSKMFAIITYGFYVVLAVVLFLVEFEPVWMLSYTLVLHFWPGRGAAQLFLGVQLLHSASMMKTVSVFGLGEGTGKHMVEGFGWCYFGTGCLYILLGVLCLRGKTDLVKKVRGQGRKGYQEVPKGSTPSTAKQQKQPASAQQATHRNLAILREMSESGVPHLANAILHLEEEARGTEESSGLSGWWKKKFGKKSEKATPARKPAEPSRSDAATRVYGATSSSPPLDSTPHSLEAVDTRQAYTSPAPVGGASCDDDDAEDPAVLRKRKEEEEERRYMARYS